MNDKQTVFFHRGKGFAVSVILCCWFFLLLRQSVYADCRFFPEQDNGSYVLADNSGRVIHACFPDKTLVPASILKIPTSLAALQLLGPDFRFKTRFFIDLKDTLFIQGFGDPMLTSEEVLLILERLKEKGVERIQNIIVDTSVYALESPVPGAELTDNPYDAPVAALSVNFNTVHFKIDSKGNVLSNEMQTPFLPLMQELADSLPPGEHRVNILQDNQDAAQTAARYGAELFRGMQKRLGLAGDGILATGKVAANAQLVYEHLNSRTLAVVLSACLKHSSNFIANQVFLACGVKKYGYPVTWKKGRDAVREELELLLGSEYISQIHMVEGSGLSRQNKVTAGAMLQILKHFRLYRDLLPEIKGNRLKSGTLNDVFSYAGYLNGEKPFIIILNQKENLRDRVLEKMMSFRE